MTEVLKLVLTGVVLYGQMVVIVLTDSLLQLQNLQYIPVLQWEIGIVLVSDTGDLLTHYRMGGMIGDVALQYFHISVVNQVSNIFLSKLYLKLVFCYQGVSFYTQLQKLNYSKN